MNKVTEEENKFRNVSRDEATLGISRQAKPEQNGLADEDQPIQRPPESQPEPQPPQPTLDFTHPSNHTNSSNTNSPA